MIYQQLENGIRKYMLLADTGLVKLIVSIWAANQMPIIPPWIMLVGGSAGGKSMILNGIKDAPGLLKIDDLTSNTFLSGQKSFEKSSSLLDNLPQNPILCFSDFSTMITKNPETRAEIFSQMRRLWDGDMHKKTGNGVNKSWEGQKVPGVIGACTTTIYEVLPEMGDMGERLVLYHIKMPPRKEVAKFSIRRLNDRSQEADMKLLFNKFMAELVIPTEIPTFSDEIEDELIDLADLATRARSSIKRDQYDRGKAQLFVHDLEGPTRLLKTIMGVATGMAVVNGSAELPAEDKHTLYRLALDSIPMNRKKLLNYLTQHDGRKSVDIQIGLNMDQGVIDRTLQDLNSLEVVTKYKGTGGGWVWSLKMEYRMLLSKFEGIVLEAKDVPAEATYKGVERRETPREIEEPPEISWDGIIKPEEQGAML